MTLKIVKKTYSSNPWRLVDEATGAEVHEWQSYPESSQPGMPPIHVPVCAPTKAAMVEKVLSLLEHHATAHRAAAEQRDHYRALWHEAAALPRLAITERGSLLRAPVVVEADDP